MIWLVASVDGLVDIFTLARREWIPTPARGNQKNGFPRRRVGTRKTLPLS